MYIIYYVYIYMYICIPISFSSFSDISHRWMDRKKSGSVNAHSRGSIKKWLISNGILASNDFFDGDLAANHGDFPSCYLMNGY